MQSAIPLAVSVFGFSPEEAVTSAIFNAAYAAGRGATHGSLEIGKSADLLILNVSDYRDLAYQCGMNLVHTTIRRGEVVYREGAILRGERGTAGPPYQA
jgi:imidazolonepropionase